MPLYQQTIEKLQPTYGDRESSSLARLLFEHLGIARTTLLVDDPVLTAAQEDWVLQATSRLLKNEPIQHILGEVEFCGCRIKVNPDVLIPRPETEEMVELIIKENSGQPEILDIGTGSGCIAIALKKSFPEAKVKACDISDSALSTAQENASLNGVDIHFHHKDVLHLASIPGSNDIIVSNPPYVLEREKEQMDANVLDHEPPQALFVSNSDPLVFYTAIIELAIRNLLPNGKLYFEINESKGLEVKILMKAAGFQDVKILKDLNGKDRFATGRKQ